MLKSIVYSGLIGCLLVLCSNTAHSRNNPEPPQWPWKGISILSDMGQVDEADLEAIAALGANFVRISLRVTAGAKTRNISVAQAFEEDLQWASTMIKKSRELGMETMVNLSQYPIRENLEYTHTSADFWEKPSELQEVKATVIKTLQFLKREGAMPTAIQVLGEPVVRGRFRDSLPEEWPSFSRDLLKVIRAFDSDIYVVLSPNKWALIEGYGSIEPYEDSRVIYNTDYYTPHRYTHQGTGGYDKGLDYPGYIRLRKWDRESLAKTMSELRDFQLENEALVIVSEFSVARWAPGKDAYLKDVLELFDNNGWSHVYWCWQCGSVWDLNYAGQGSDGEKLEKTENPSWGIIKESWKRERKLE